MAPVPSEQFFVLILTGVSHRTGGRDAGQARTVEFPEEGRRGFISEYGLPLAVSKFIKREEGYSPYGSGHNLVVVFEKNGPR